MSALGLLAVLVLQGGTVHVADGPPLADASVVIADGRIRAVGPRSAVTLPPDATVIDATGLVITPGLIESQTQLGLVEISMVGGSRDQDPGLPDPIRAAFRAVDAYNPDSAVLPVQRARGITTAVSWPTGGLVSGQGVAFTLDGGEPVSSAVGMAVNLGEQDGGSRGQSLERLRELLADARAFGKSQAAFEQNRLRALSASRADLAALQPVLAGTLPLVIHADRRSDIRASLALAAEERVRIVLVSGAEAWLEAPALARAGVPVIVDPIDNLPSSFDRIRVPSDLAARLDAAGVTVVLSTFDTHRARTLRQAAGNAVRSGLAADAALRAITANPAKVFGLSDRGAIAVGQVADLVAWTGDPFELSSAARHVIIGGQLQPSGHRQRQLLDRYRHLPPRASAP
ncbi:MAG: amidohydrolase family protein [bacterium]